MWEKLDHIKSNDLNRWLKYVGWTEEKFDLVCNTYRNPRVWWIENGKWAKYDINGKKILRQCQKKIRYMILEK